MLVINFVKSIPKWIKIALIAAFKWIKIALKLFVSIPSFIGAIIEKHKEFHRQEREKVIAANEKIQCLLRKIAKANKELRMYKEFWDYAQEAFLLVSAPDGDILDANPMACSLYGYQQRQMKALNMRDISAELEGTQSVFDERITFVPIRYHRNHDQTKILVSASVSYFNDQGKDVVAIIVRPILEKRLINGSPKDRKYEGAYISL